MMPPKKDTHKAGKETGRKSVETDTDRNPTYSFSGNTPTIMTADTNKKGNKTREGKEVKPATQPGSPKKNNAGVGGGQTTGHGEPGNTNKQLPQLMDGSVPNSPEMDTDGAQSESSEKDKEMHCTNFKTVWGLRLDFLLLAIVVVIAAVLLKLPLGEKHVMIENPAIQQQLRDLTEQFKNIENKIKELKSEVNINSVRHSEQESKLDIIKYDIKMINDNLIFFDPEEMLYTDIKTTVSKIQKSIAKSHTDIAAVEKNHTALNGSMGVIKRDLSAFITKEEELNSDLTKNINNIREDLDANIDASSKLSGRLEDVEFGTNILQRDLSKTNSKVDGMNKSLGEADTKVSEVKKSAETAENMVDQANAKLKIVEQHLFNKDALTAAILILFFLIIGLMLYVLKLKSSFESPLAGRSSSRPLKGSREMEVILQRMPSTPTLDNAVCIVSFDASNSDEYKRMIKETVGQLKEVSFRTHVIRKHADIAELPHCRLYIMCVEFTERHVIIEEQGLGLGDLKLTSYRGVRKLGGALVILYVHDPGSRNLSDDQLYSDGVYCVNKQQELKELRDKDRFISAHKKLNTAQKKALETAIIYELKIQAAR